MYAYIYIHTYIHIYIYIHIHIHIHIHVHIIVVYVALSHARTAPGEPPLHGTVVMVTKSDADLTTQSVARTPREKDFRSFFRSVFP